jgi:23S rRNA-/tRNA-specific pseudouridylate synthase
LRASSGPHSGRRGRAAQGAPGSPRASGAPAAPGLLLDRVLYRDALCLVVDKPAGLPVHAGPKGGPNLEDHLDALRFGLPRRPGLAHRLDRDTSGCLVLGRHRQALARLGKLFASGRVEKVYWAVVRGGPRAEEGRIEAPLRKRDELRGWWMETHPKGQPAVTDWRVLGRSADGGRRGSSAGRVPGARTRSGCTAPRCSAARSWATRSTGRGGRGRRRRSTCTPGP